MKMGLMELYFVYIAPQQHAGNGSDYDTMHKLKFIPEQCKLGT